MRLEGYSMGKCISIKKLKGTKQVKETKEVKLLNGTDKVDYRKGCERSDG